MNNVKKSIGWCDYTVNPVKGLCPVGCSYCYARAMYKRFKMDETIRYDPSVFNKMDDSPKRVFVGSTIDLFHPLTSIWNDDIFRVCKCHPDITFIFLTKRPENLIKWSPFPANVWVGISAWDRISLQQAVNTFHSQRVSQVQFISIEPLLNWQNVGYSLNYKNNINWLIIGQQTPVKQSTMPKIEWVREIVEAADMAGIPVFLKDNLNSCEISDYPELLDKNGNLRQEFPEVKG